MDDRKLLERFVDGWRELPEDPMWFHEDAVAVALRKARKQALEEAMAGEPELPEFLEWLADRLVQVYGESPNTDFVLGCRRRAGILRALKEKD